MLTSKRNEMKHLLDIDVVSGVLGFLQPMDGLTLWVEPDHLSREQVFVFKSPTKCHFTL